MHITTFSDASPEHCYWALTFVLNCCAIVPPWQRISFTEGLSGLVWWISRIFLNGSEKQGCAILFGGGAL